MRGSILLLGLAKRAGRLEIGEESVASAVLSGRVRAVLSASDASERSQRRAQSLAGRCGAEHMALPFTKDELGEVLGRGSPGLTAITDAGLAASFAEKLATEYPPQYAEAAQRLSQNAERAQTRKKKTAAPSGSAGTCKRRKINEHNI